MPKYLKDFLVWS